eukprot:TRINITY_DN6755_c0_g1_i4.p1 TRINITY_DN6755_c0_g1~~TRINITY_DN6755_c0_g1_i4.p1  ORF type:complete len:218 (+),score=28.62 TRINITY_DN6755_c0_g1_i4:382-1035(+)
MGHEGEGEMKNLIEIVKDSSSSKNLIEIVEDSSSSPNPNPIDVMKYINSVRSPKSGAIATFEGTTRDSFQGKRVVELRYEAYVPMAIRRLKTICCTARSSWNLDSIAVAHRLGSVPVGESSVFIAISAVHRIDALDACKYVIDEIKASVPIWKKEVYDNGEVWKENSEFLERRKTLSTTSTLGLGMVGCCGRNKFVEDDGQQEQEHEHEHEHGGGVV